MDDAAIHRVSGDVGGFISLVTESHWIATGFALAMTIIGEKGRSELTFHSSPLALPSLAFLETYTEAHVAAAETGGVADALSRTQVRPGVVPGTTPLDPMRARDWT